MYFGCIYFRGELGFLNCDDICICVVNKQFELHEFFFYSVYVDLQYDEISLTFLLLGLCPCVVSVIVFEVVPYVDVMVAVTVMRRFQRSQPTRGGTVWQQQTPANRDQLLS